MTESRKINMPFIAATAVLLAMFFTSICASGQPGSTTGQQGAISGGGPGGPDAGAPGPGGGPGGMPGGDGGGPPMQSNEKINAAIYIENGAYLSEESTPAAVTGGKIGKNSASGVKVTSDTDKFVGIYVKGSESEYTLSDSTIDLYGNATGPLDENVGAGAGAVVNGGGTLILKNVRITTNGRVSSTAVSLGDSTLKVYDSTLVANGGIVTEGINVGSGPGSIGPPAALGITGMSRATNAMGNGHSYFYNSTIIADAWGALSTDAGRNVYVEANNCEVQVIKSGYGAYADGGCEVVINNSRFNVATHVGILAGTGKITLNNVAANSGGSCVMIHDVMGSISEVGTLKISGGNISTENALILVKSANADITVDGAELVSKGNVLIQSVLNDDENTTKVNGQQVVGINVSLKKMTLEGNILHDDPERQMTVALEGTTLKGAIKNASVSLDSKSRWTATADSDITLMGSIDIKSIDAPDGVTIIAQAGKGCALKGSYKLADGGVLKIKGS